MGFGVNDEDTTGNTVVEVIKFQINLGNVLFRISFHFSDVSTALKNWFNVVVVDRKKLKSEEILCLYKFSRSLPKIT